MKQQHRGARLTVTVSEDDEDAVAECLEDIEAFLLIYLFILLAVAVILLVLRRPVCSDLSFALRIVLFKAITRP